MGKRVCGFTTDEIQALTIGSDAPGWSASDRALIRAVEELIDDAMISDDSWAALSEGRDAQQLIELPLLVAQYMGVAFLQNALRIRMLDGNVGLSAR
jgi:alkylhydroperoxidase family enzyme